MGHDNSKSAAESPDVSSQEDPKSRVQRVKQKLHLRRHLCRRSSGSSGFQQSKLLTEEDFAGIALIRLIKAEMQFKDKWLACVSFGEQTFRTRVSDQLSAYASGYVESRPNGKLVQSQVPSKPLKKLSDDMVYCYTTECAKKDDPVCPQGVCYCDEVSKICRRNDDKPEY